MLKSFIYKVFPFTPLLAAIGFIVYHINFGVADAQDAIAYLFLLLYSLQGMLLFTAGGLVYFLIKKRVQSSYYKILFYILSGLNLLVLVLWCIMGLWIPALVLILGIIAGFWSIKKSNTFNNVFINPASH
ncbi:MAG: hypothetical protein ABFD18_13960 [Syntrophomonas sp.]